MAESMDVPDVPDKEWPKLEEGAKPMNTRLAGKVKGKRKRNRSVTSGRCGGLPWPNGGAVSAQPHSGESCPTDPVSPSRPLTQSGCATMTPAGNTPEGEGGEGKKEDKIPGKWRRRRSMKETTTKEKENIPDLTDPDDDELPLL